MLENRELSIRVKRPSKGTEQDETQRDIAIFEDRLALTHTVVKDVVKTVFIGVLAYVAADTLRQVLVSKNTNPKY